ncbi:MAG: malto-oligosyltrehalose trehalohydrolase [Gammaproteobacteria bacterium]
MPFGAELRADGTRFRLWAPARQSVDLLIVDRSRELPMRQLDDGWFELTTREAVAGSLYWFQFDDGVRVPDPASRVQADDVHGPSVVVDPARYRWRHNDQPRPAWDEAVIYELHVGAFSDEGTFDGVRARLDHLVTLGVSVIELMPVADFPGSFNWGYDGVLPFAPDRSYGPTDSLKRLIDAAHGRRLAVVLDVVYNHFGPDGNYLHLYAPQFFDNSIHTPWGAAIDFTQRPVREFFIHDALYWLEEYCFDGLRLDAVHAIHDESKTHFLSELATRVRDEHGNRPWLILENDDNAARYLRAGAGSYTAQWNDDFHHVAHVLLTGEQQGYYADYTKNSLQPIGHALTQGFIYQGQPSSFCDGAPRGEPSGHLPPGAFVHFLQNHDQIGNRAFGERLTTLIGERALRAMLTVLLLSPQPPLLFMGEEWGSKQPFLYFCDYADELATVVRDGRRREFEKFPQFTDPKAREAIPDPNVRRTFDRSRLDWPALDLPQGRAWLEFLRSLLRVRRQHVIPASVTHEATESLSEVWNGNGLHVTWSRDDVTLILQANLSPKPAMQRPEHRGRLLFEWPAGAGDGTDMQEWSAALFLARAKSFGRPRRKHA